MSLSDVVTRLSLIEVGVMSVDSGQTAAGGGM